MRFGHRWALRLQPTTEMKNLRRFIALLLAMGACSLSAQAGQVNVRIYLEYIEVAHQTVTELMASKAGKDGALHTRLRGLVKAKKARIHETEILSARSGQKAALQSINEFIYPTEVADNVAPPTTPDGPLVQPNPPAVRANEPIAFETRDVGVSMEFEATVLEDGKSVDLIVDSDLVDYLHLKEWFTQKDSFGEAGTSFPVFRVLANEQRVVVRAGQFTLLGVLHPREREGGEDVRLMLFAKVDVLPRLTERKKP